MVAPKKTLTEIYRPISRRLGEVDRAFEKQLEGYDHVSNRILDSLLGDPGKKLRPALVLFCSKFGGRMNRRVIQIATAVELLHTATLIHDDVLDEAILRRQKESINSRWGNEISVVLGDYIYSKAFILMSQMGLPMAFQLLSETARTMCIGELAQLVKRYDFALLEREYVRMIQFMAWHSLDLPGCGWRLAVGPLIWREFSSLSGLSSFPAVSIVLRSQASNDSQWRCRSEGFF